MPSVYSRHMDQMYAECIRLSKASTHGSNWDLHAWVFVKCMQLVYGITRQRYIMW
jgi:hypothetical protein